MAGTPPTNLLTAEQVSELVDAHFPQVHAGGKQLYIESVGPRTACVRLAADDAHMRPGGTVSGPTMFKLADFSVWVAILAALGEHGLQAVTTSLTINFLSRPAPGDMRAEVRLIKMGRRLAVGEAELYSDGREDMVAHATATYAIPPENLAVE